jgi:hypothetical protein
MKLRCTKVMMWFLFSIFREKGDLQQNPLV